MIARFVAAPLIVGLAAACGLDPIVGTDCLAHLMVCDGRCIDPRNDNANCGRCGIACLEGTSCVAGLCTADGCELPEIWCDGEACTNLDIDPQNCGDCGHECEPGERCADGQCVGECPDDRLLCGESCVNPANDPNNCGDCDVVCDADQVCAEGSCAGGCGGLTECDRICVDVTNDPNNCGDCGIRCADSEVCSEGNCARGCGELTKCNRTCVDVTNDPNNCGGCGIRCADNDVCETSSCVSCDGDEVRCDNECVDVDTDSNNCGECMFECEGLEECQRGECILICPDPLIDCGLERCVNVRVEPDHCGECDHACAVFEMCQDGLCVEQCGSGLDPCNRQCVDLQTDPDNCGGCSRVCDTGICEAGECRSGAIGHLVGIGHDYLDTRRDQNRLVGNAVLIPQGSVNVLTYAEHAEPDTVVGVIAAVNSVAADLVRTVAFVELEDPQLLAQELVDYDVFLVYAQSLAEWDTLEALGELWSLSLTAFVARGGVIVFLDAAAEESEVKTGGTWRIFGSAGFIEASGTFDVSGEELQVVGGGDAVAAGMPASYRGELHSCRFATTEGNVVVASDEGTVVFHKVFSPQ